MSRVSARDARHVSVRRASGRPPEATRGEEARGARPRRERDARFASGARRAGARASVAHDSRRAFRAQGERHETASDSRRSAKPRRWFQTETKERRDRRSKGKPNRASVDRKTIAHGKKVWRYFAKHGRGDERKERKIDFARIRAARSVVGRGYCLLSHPKRTQNTLDTEYATPNTPSHDHRYVRQTTASSIR